MYGNPDPGVQEIFACGTNGKWNLKSWALDSGIQLKESGIQVLLTKNSESSTWSPESTVWNPRFQDCLGFPLHGAKLIKINYSLFLSL